jgi:hypothetical protein
MALIDRSVCATMAGSSVRSFEASIAQNSPEQ